MKLRNGVSKDSVALSGGVFGALSLVLLPEANVVLWGFEFVGSSVPKR